MCILRPEARGPGGKNQGSNLNKLDSEHRFDPGVSTQEHIEYDYMVSATSCTRCRVMGIQMQGARFGDLDDE